MADEHRPQRPARVQHLGHQPVPVGAREAGVHQQRIALAGDQRPVLFFEPTGKSRSMILKSSELMSPFVSWLTAPDAPRR
jgi:hypothetical protein